VATALAADRRDRSGRRHTLHPRETRTEERNREQPNRNPGGASAPPALASPQPTGRAFSGPCPHSRRTCLDGNTDQVDLEVSLKDTEGPDQKVTLQAWLAGRAHLVATSHERALDHALAQVRRDLIRRIEEERCGVSLASAGRPVIARPDPASGSQQR
jgi:hypothetical protein